MLCKKIYVYIRHAFKAANRSIGDPKSVAGNRIGRYASLFNLKHFAGWSTLEPAKRYVHNNQYMLRKAIDDAGL